MQRESVPLYQNRAPLFPGRSCFPLSAETSNTYEDRKDQLNVIFAVIGTPSAEDIAALSDENAREYLHGLPRREPLNLAKVYSGASKAAISLLLGMLHFNPRKVRRGRRLVACSLTYILASARVLGSHSHSPAFSFALTLNYTHQCFLFLYVYGCSCHRNFRCN